MAISTDGSGSWIQEELRERKVRKKDLPVREDFAYSPRGSYRNFNPYDVAFCYPHPLYDRPFILKGGHQDIRKYLKKMNIPMIVHHTFYKKGNRRIVYEFYCVEKGIQIQKRYNFSPETKKYLYSRYFELTLFNFTNPKKVLAKFKRVPRRWIRELNLYVTTERRTFHDK